MDSYVNGIIHYFVEVLTSIHIGIIFFKSLAKLFEFTLKQIQKIPSVWSQNFFYGKIKWIETLVHVKNALHDNKCIIQILYGIYLDFLLLLIVGRYSLDLHYPTLCLAFS
jgi:hypothetical protein